MLEAKQIFGAIAVVLAFGCYVPYYAGIFRGTVKPHIVTYLVWVVAGVITFIASWISGGAAGSWSLAASTLLLSGVFVLSFHYGTKDINRFDIFCCVAAFLAIAAWLYAKEPTISVIFATVIETLSFLPTFRKTWKEPSSEFATSWLINTVKHAITIVALGSYSIATVLYPAVLVLLNGLLAAEIYYRCAVLRRK